MLLYNNKAGYICCCLLLFVKNLTNWHEGVLLFFSGRLRGHPDGVLIHVRQRQHVSRIQHNAAVLPQAFSRLNFFFIRVAGHFSQRSPSTLIRRFISRVVCSSNMGKRSRQRQKNQPAGRDDRDSVRFTLLLQQLLLMLGRKCSFRPRLITFIY